MNRESIYAALFSKLSASAKFTTASRRLRHWSDVPPTDQPALFQAQRDEVAQTVPGMPTIWSLHVDVYLYANTGGDSTISPAQILNPLVDAIVAALAPEAVSNKQTLGGLVQHAWIEGQIQTDEGALGDQAVAIVPIILKTT